MKVVYAIIFAELVVMVAYGLLLVVTLLMDYRRRRKLMYQNIQHAIDDISIEITENGTTDPQVLRQSLGYELLSIYQIGYGKRDKKIFDQAMEYYTRPENFRQGPGWEALRVCLMDFVNPIKRTI